MADCEPEIIGVKKIALYINKEVDYNYPDPSIENEVDIIVHETGSFITNQVNQYPKWKRTLGYSGNYKTNYLDEFTFFLHGIQNNIPEILKSLRNNRLGYIVKIITTGNQSYVFPSPVFLNAKNTKQIDSHSWTVSLSNRIETFQDYLINLNTTFWPDQKFLITMTPTALFTVGVDLTFTGGTFIINWKDSSAEENFISGTELPHQYVSSGTYISEVSGPVANITTLVIDNSKITVIDISAADIVTNVLLFNNLLTVLDVSNNTLLALFWCHENSIAVLDVSNNTLLTSLRCDDNSLTALDVSSNILLDLLWCYSNSIISIDASSNTLLTSFRCDDNSLTALDVSSNTLLTLFYCHENSITSLDISNNTSLTLLRCYSNSLTSLDVSNNTLLTLLYCQTNSITVLDVSSNTLLTALICTTNGLTATAVDNIYIDLDGHGLSNGTLIITAGNTTRTSASDAARTSLLGKGWAIT